MTRATMLRYTAPVLFLSTALLAHADTVFNVSGSFETGRQGDSQGVYDHSGALTGTITLNAAQTGFSAVDLTTTINLSAHPGITTATIAFRTIGASLTAPSGEVGVQLSGASTSGIDSVATLNLFLPVTSLMGYQGGEVCDVSTSCSRESGGPVSSYVYRVGNYSSVLDNVRLTNAAPPPPPPTAVTPEPSSLMLVCTGLFGAAGLVRRYAA